jgi:hypothetical protein
LKTLPGDISGQARTQSEALPAIVTKVFGDGQYTLGHADRIATMASARQHLPGLYMSGNYIGGVSVANCLKTARQTANKVSRCLEQIQHGGSNSTDVNVYRSQLE